MAITPSAAKGSVGLMIEGTSGMQSILTNQAVSATITGLSAPTGSTGMKLYIKITGWTASGTFTITGTGSPGSTETVTVAAPSAQQQQSVQIASFEYVSVNNYTTLTNITTTGLTNGFIAVYGIQAAKYNIPVTKFVSGRKVTKYSPNQYTGLMARDTRLIDTHNETDIKSFDSDFYADLSLYWVYMLVGSPQWSTIPGTPTSLKTTTALTSSPITLTAQPLAPGQKLIIAATGYTSTPVVLTISGTSYGSSVTETISITANGTYYSSYAYSAVSGIATDGNASGVSIAITGVFGWSGTVTSEGNRSTAAVEHFDGVGSWIHPFVYGTDGDFTINSKGEAKLTMKSMAQDKLAIGDRTTTPLHTNRTTSIGFPTSDLPMAGWQAQVYLDDVTGTAGTTVFLDPDEEIKIALKSPIEAHWTFNNQQTFTRAYMLKYECDVDVTYDIINLLQHEKFRANQKQYLQVATIGEYIGTTGGVQYNRGWTWTLPVRYNGEYGQEGDPGKGGVFAKPKLKTEYDSSLGGSYSLTIVTRTPPTYTS